MKVIEHVIVRRVSDRGFQIENDHGFQPVMYVNYFLDILNTMGVDGWHYAGLGVSPLEMIFWREVQ